MPRSYRLLAIATLAALLFSATPAAAASTAGWSFFDRFSPFDWINHLWGETGSEISPWGKPAPTVDGTAPPGALRQVWAEEGAGINPWGLVSPLPHAEGSQISPWGLQ